MEESQKRASSGKLKEKSSLLELDIGNDFVTSWKSMSMAEDDAMDFDFAPDSKDKKKSFNFDKADMDFNMDADFGKISSFNMDIPDLDISSPFKKDGKSKEKSKSESANGKNKAKVDHFSFALDFDELGSFSFGSSLTKEGTKAEKNNDRGKNSKRGECQDEKDPSHTNFIENTSMPENELFEKPLSPGTTPTSNMDTQVDGSAGIDSPSKKSPSELVMGDIGTSNFSTAIDQVAEQKARKSPDLKFSSSRQQNSCQFEKTISPEPVNQEACRTNGASQDLSAHSASGEASQITGSRLLEVEAVDTNSNSSSGEQNVIEKPIAGSDSIGENTKVENSYLQGVAISQKNNGEENQVGTENHSLIGNKEYIEHGQGDSIVQNSPITIVVTGSNAENQGQASEILKSPLTSKPVDHFISEEERGAVVTRSRFFMRPDKAEPYLQKAPSAQTTASSLSSKVMSPTEPSPLDENRDPDAIDIVGDGILASFPLQHSRTVIRREPHQRENQEICKGLTIDGQGTSADGVQDGRKLNKSFPTQDQDVVEAKSAQKESQENAKNVDTLSLNMQLSKNTPQNHPFPRISASATTSLLTTKNTSAEAEKSSRANSSRRMLDPCGLKLSRTSGSDLEFSKSVTHEDVKSLGSSSQKRNLLGKEPSKITPSASGTASLLTMKNSSAEAKKFNQVNAGGRNLDLCGLRLSRTSESNHDSTKSVGCKDVKSLGNISQNKLMSGHESSNSTIGTLKKTPSPPSLKRKTLGEFNSSMMLLNPSKRLSQSPSENRNFAAISERVVDKKVSNHESLEDGSTKSTYQDSTLDASHEMNMKELDAPFSIENNTHVEQAEACTKELEDICNMLSKKHEEAKEILVRAIVNNNKLLMLNHPLYEEKIQMVQKFAARLTLSETHA
ncbi:uncharacterized protein At4g18490 isoform X2 [Olea europaea var. sylvestris]|uniref:uncharacterized protein At4g18490 isoform X2 n=1 Tax=Olea europaea var. sylvestris TaxID=158386 RepID=UPI000C1D1194|nr:uncharacterized protein At4g18490 isoform X2 [Olea europaea var. sylvestris]